MILDTVTKSVIEEINDTVILEITDTAEPWCYMEASEHVFQRINGSGLLSGAVHDVIKWEVDQRK